MEPTYPLDRIRSLVGQEGAWLITLTAQQTALQIGCDEQDIVLPFAQAPPQIWN